jgi:hypothetical protein
VAVLVAGLVVQAAAMADGGFVVGSWQSTAPNNPYVMNVQWDPRTRRFEGRLAAQGALSQQLGFALGEVCWLATPAPDPSILRSQQKVRWGGRADWRPGIVYLRNSNPNLLVTSIGTFRRVMPLGAGQAAPPQGMYPPPSQPGYAYQGGAQQNPNPPQAPQGDVPPPNAYPQAEPQRPAEASYSPPSGGQDQPAERAESTRVPPAPPDHGGDSGLQFIKGAPQPMAYALIIGIEKYRDVPTATGARADAQRFADLARRTFGLPDDHIRMATEDRATRSDILEGLNWLKKMVEPGGRAYFYFSGHGAPSPDASTYLLPYDGNPKDLANSAVPMAQIERTLAETKATDVLAVVDSCFSGAGGRSVLPPGARPLIAVKDAKATGKVAMFSASQHDEISGPASSGGGGAFTKFVIEGLATGQADQNGDGRISLKELSDWVAPRVARDAKKDNRDQHPILSLGKGVSDPAKFIVEFVPTP